MEYNRQGKIRKGALLVFEGTDGSGKTTQLEILQKRLLDQGYEVEVIDFPQYGKKSAGLVEEYLNGKYGSLNEVSPYQASVLYAADRFDASSRVKDWLQKGRIVIANRYVLSNMAHQGCKLEDRQERSRFFRWLRELEYEVFGIPRPDLNIILHIEAEAAYKLVGDKYARDYIENASNRDIHENDAEHLRQAEQAYVQIANEFSGNRIIPCTRNGIVLSRQEVHERVWQAVLDFLPSAETYAKAPDFKRIHEEQLRALAGKTLGYAKTKIEKNFLPEKIDARQSRVRKFYYDASGNGTLTLRARDYYTLFPGEQISIPTGLRVRLPQGYVGTVWGDSRLSAYGVNILSQVINSEKDNEISISLANLGQDNFNISPGQALASLVVQETAGPDVIEFL